MIEPSELTIAEATAAMHEGQLTSVQLVRSAIRAADRAEPRLEMFVARFVDDALASAEAADEAMAAGRSLGVLHGIPVAIKDMLSTSERGATAQSKVISGSWFDGDAASIGRLRRAGAVFVGHTTTMEYAIGAPEPPASIPRNPWDRDRWAGGSSSGSASSVAVGAALGSLGTDTVGSVRIPSAFCGVTGLKPTFGRVSRTGCIPLSSSLDHIGPIARDAADTAVLLQVVAGYDTSDPMSIDHAVDDYINGLCGDLEGLRVGVDRLSRFGGSFEDQILPGVFSAAIAVLADRGAKIVDIELPHYLELSTACAIIMASEALANHLPRLQNRWEDHGSSTRIAVGSGIFYSAADYVQAQRVRRMGRAEIAALFGECDLIVTPTAGVGATPVSLLHDVSEAIASGTFGAIYTPYWDLLGHPALSVPMGLTHDGLPLGLQIVGRPFEEATVLRAGDAYQRATDWHRRRPVIWGDTDGGL